MIICFASTVVGYWVDDSMNAKQALDWVKECGITMESAQASVPSLAEPERF